MPTGPANRTASGDCPPVNLGYDYDPRPASTMTVTAGDDEIPIDCDLSEPDPHEAVDYVGAIEDRAIAAIRDACPEVPPELMPDLLYQLAGKWELANRFAPCMPADA